MSLRWIAVAAALCAVLMLPVAWEASQGWVFPDAISYLDMASGAVRGSPAVLLKNAYWSPGYPAILALMMAVVRPTLAAELHAVHVLHWLIFLFTTACFSWLVWNLLQWLRSYSWPTLDGESGSIKALVCFGYSVFVLSNMNRTMWYVTPDMLLQGLVYLSAACALRLFLQDGSWKHSVALGLALGAGYWAKAAMCPSAILLILVLFFHPPKGRPGRGHAVIALACFCLAAAPLVLSLSHEKHRFTFGDTAKLAYAWFVNGIPPYAGWTGQPAWSGTPAHAPRKVSEHPLILEFRTPVSGTLPIWYDPSYWWEGVRVPFSVRRQWTALLRPFREVHSRQTELLGLAAALAPLCLLSRRVRKAIRASGSQAWILILWPAIVCAMHCLLLFTYRFLIAYFVLISLGVAGLMLQPSHKAGRARTLFAAALLLAAAGELRLGLVLQAAFHPSDGGSLTREEGRDNGPSSAAVARQLTRLGIRPGDEISALGYGFDCYYARLAGVRIVAQIWEDPDRIVNLSAPEVRRVLAQLKEIGVKALVSRVKPGFVNDDGWIAIPRTDVYVRVL